VRTVVRPSWRGSDEQRQLVDAVNAAIEEAEEVTRKADEKIWERARAARDAGVPDTQLCRLTGLNRATLNRKLGPRGDSAPE
jgi:hypothetical protein